MFGFIRLTNQSETKVQSVGGAGGAVKEMMEVWPNPDEISPDLARSH